jgi:hypothetical protein
LETLTEERDGPALGWLAVIGLFDAVVALGLLLAGRWPALLLLTAAVLGSGACLLTGWFTGARGRPRLVTPRSVRGHEWE